MGDVAFVNNSSIICQNPKVTAINSCIEVDLTGQVVSDSIGTKMHSGKSTSDQVIIKSLKFPMKVICSKILSHKVF